MTNSIGPEKPNVDLSIIIPYAGEYPQAMFTVAAIHESMRLNNERSYPGISYEVVVVDNWCQELEEQLAVVSGPTAAMNNRSREAFDAATKRHDWLVSTEYRERLSHWQAKNIGVAASSGKVLFFCDAHVVPATDVISRLYYQYKQMEFELSTNKFTLHTPNTYKILEHWPDMYKLVPELERGWLGYSLTPARDLSSDKCGIFEVPCASSCGMMISRDLLTELGPWPQRYAYSGGEHFINFTMAILGYPKYMMVGECNFLRHHGAPRDYHYTYDGMVDNRLRAVYMWGGVKMAELFLACTKGNRVVLHAMLSDAHEELKGRRAAIVERQKYSPREWVDLLWSR